MNGWCFLFFNVKALQWTLKLVYSGGKEMSLTLETATAQMCKQMCILSAERW